MVPANGWWCLVAGKVTVFLASHWPRLQTLVVLHLRAQGLGEGDEHPPTFSYWNMVNFTFFSALTLWVGWQEGHTACNSLSPAMPKVLRGTFRVPVLTYTNRRPKVMALTSLWHSSGTNLLMFFYLKFFGTKTISRETLRRHCSPLSGTATLTFWPQISHVICTKFRRRLQTVENVIQYSWSLLQHRCSIMPECGIWWVLCAKVSVK